MKPSHKSLAPAAVVAVVVSVVVVVVVAIAADAVASNKAPTRCSYRRGASIEAPLHILPRSSYLIVNLPQRTILSTITTQLPDLTSTDCPHRLLSFGSCLTRTVLLYLPI
jgi:hypothetical protein